MNPRAQVEAALEQWHGWATAEAEAIRSRDWVRLAGCQAAISQLQSQLTPLLEALRQVHTAANSSATFPPAPLQRRVQQLLELEGQNAALLEAARRAAQGRIEQFGQVTRTLHRLRSSYSSAHSSHWNSFS